MLFISVLDKGRDVLLRSVTCLTVFVRTRTLSCREYCPCTSRMTGTGSGCYERTVLIPVRYLARLSMAIPIEAGSWGGSN